MKTSLFIAVFFCVASMAFAQTQAVGPKLVIEADGHVATDIILRTAKALHVYIKPARAGVSFTVSELTVTLMRGGIPQGDPIKSASGMVDITPLMRIAKADDFLNIHLAGVKRKGVKGDVTDFTDESVLGGGLTVK